MMLGVTDLVSPRIDIHHSRGTWQSATDQIIPAITVEVVNPGKEVIGISLPVLRNRRIDLVLLLELRAFPPVRSVNDIGPTVLIQVAKVGSLRKILVRQLLSLKCMDGEVLSGGLADQGDRRTGP